VLAGPSGSGMSSLARLYAEALGNRDEFLHVPVRPNWTDDRGLLGSVHSETQRFEPSSTGLLDHLITAAADDSAQRGGLYVVCLDRMNAAPVEDYFALFLSALELPPAERTLTAFAPGIVRADDPYYSHQRVRMGENVRFVGTVNTDECR